MREQIRSRLIVVSFIGDLLVVAAMLMLAYWMRFETILKYYGTKVEPTAWLNLDAYKGHVVLGTTLLLLLLGNFRIYAPSYIHSVRRHWRIIGQACALWVLGYLTISLILKVNPPISRVYCVLGGGLCFVALGVWRKVLHVWMSRARMAGKITQQVLFVGWSAESNRLMSIIESDPNHIYDVVGIVPSGDWHDEAPPAHIPRLGDYGEIEAVLARHEVDLVLMTDMGVPKDDLMGVAAACEKAMVEFKLIPSVFQILVSGLHLENIGGIPLLGISRLPLHGTFNSYLKRGVDVLGGLFGLLISAPVIAFFGLMIKLEDRGPIFYRQTRLGRNGKLFSIFKLRSMRLDSETGGRVGWSVKNDPRCLRVGAFMRRWNIDEVPQFWNVLKGEMSLVGPRPERPELIQRFKDEIRHYNARHNIKPGITGWAQVNGLRGDTDLTERVKYDLYYIENWNIWLDFQIMVMTFFKRENAC